VIEQGINLRDAFRYALKNGYSFEHRRRTGEKFVRHPDQTKPIVINCRRKDAPRALICFLNKTALPA
jgi:hypothetical protein